ncbi:MAG: glutaredoxin domain-containing protein [Actinomycetota bacterium]
MGPAVTMYSTTWCGHCRRLSRQLDDAGIQYRVVDVDEEPEMGERIVATTGGYRVVPTLEVDGQLLVNPSLLQVRAALEGLART